MSNRLFPLPPVLLSEVASTIEYYQVGDDKYPITDVVAVEGRFHCSEPAQTLSLPAREKAKTRRIENGI